MHSRYINRYRNRGFAFLFKLFYIIAHLVPHIVINVKHISILFYNWYKLIRIYHTSVLTLPSNKCFTANYTSCTHINLWLYICLYAVILKCWQYIILYLFLKEHFLTHISIIELIYPEYLALNPI